jgi:hypothetical protein
MSKFSGSRFYNLTMRQTSLSIPKAKPLLSLFLAAAATAVCAQSPQAASQDARQPDAPARIEQRGERIHLEDKGAVIDELRVGGETKSIDVQPKGGMPAYQLAPASGQRSWKILGF